ncbi:SAM-dependent methyltransferase [Haloactinomyces albus]|uniref:S-adenosyl methyltransferase n=1 Tax=Haloactinomyces albus TaxID=1352928 RepID=A0AAE3ZB74_9ACTN|nr:SAM-dependent methyltransferase [Haloactinomyces albus]MDR7300451.1 hypothetical protein [Haloactinomyces albus]
MTEQATWSPDEIDEEVPSAARIYDYLLGGAHNFAVDRCLGEKFLTALPSARNVARLNRAFLRRAVVALAESGVRQFLDLGSGIPTVGNVHEIAHGLDPQAGVVYVDSESIAVAHSELLLDGDHRTAVIQANLREPGSILRHPETRRLLDFSQPIGLLMVGVLHFVPTRADAAGIVRQYRDELPSGSFLALSHFTADVEPDEMAEVVEVMRHSADPVHPRTRDEITKLFDGFELLDPGVVGTAHWRPNEPDASAEQPGGTRIYAGVGRKL